MVQKVLPSQPSKHSRNKRHKLASSRSSSDNHLSAQVSDRKPLTEENCGEEKMSTKKSSSKTKLNKIQRDSARSQSKEEKIIEFIQRGLRYGLFPAMVGFAPWMFFFCFFKATGWPTTCFPFPKLYEDYSTESDENMRAYEEVKDDLETSIDNQCSNFAQYSMDYLCDFVIFLMALNLVASFVWHTPRAKFVWKCVIAFIYTQAVFYWFFFGLWNPAYEHSVTILWLAHDSSLLLGSFLTGFLTDRKYGGWKIFFFTYALLCCIFYFNTYAIPLFLVNKTFLQYYVLFFPLGISICELCYVRIIGKLKWYQGVDSKGLIMVSKFMLATFQTYNYAMILYTYRDEDRPLFIANLCISAAANIFSRARMIQQVAVMMYNKLKSFQHGEQHKPLRLRPRNYYERNYYGMKYEIEYIPLCAILLIRILDWVPLAQYGNHLNAYSQPDPDFYLPTWLYYAFFIEAISSDIVVFLLTRDERRQKIYAENESATIKEFKWAALAYFCVVGEVTGTLLTQSASMATYKFETSQALFALFEFFSFILLNFPERDSSPSA